MQINNLNHTNFKCSLQAILPAWVPGSQQDTHEFLLSTFQKFLIKRTEVGHSADLL